MLTATKLTELTDAVEKAPAIIPPSLYGPDLTALAIGYFQEEIRKPDVLAFSQNGISEGYRNFLALRLLALTDRRMAGPQLLGGLPEPGKIRDFLPRCITARPYVDPNEEDFI